MPTQKDITFLLSGGSSNIDPDNSLGGEPSTMIIGDGLNNLFRNLTRKEVQSGYTDYRCFYIKNVSNNYWGNLKIFMKVQGEGGAVCTLGVEMANDLQQFNVMSNHGVTSGYFVIKFNTSADALYNDYYTVTTSHIDYDSDIDAWANNFRSALLGVGFSSDITVEGVHYPHVIAPGGYKVFDVFNVSFEGEDGLRNQPLLTPYSNHLHPTTSLSSYKTRRGAPSNTIATRIPNDITAPKNVVFYTTTSDTSISIGKLAAGEVVPIWVKRYVPPVGEQVSNDNFTLGFKGTAILGCEEVPED